MANAIPGSDNRVLRVCRLLNAERARYLVAGGVVANLHGSVRATRDLIRSKETGRASDVADLEVLRALRPKRR